MIKWTIRIAIFAVLVIAAIITWQMVECRKKAKISGKPFKCKLFKSEPVYVNPVREYYRIKDDGKCYRIMDYGKRMSFSETSIYNCR